MVAALLAANAVSGLFRVWHGSVFAIAGGRFVYFAPLMGLLAYRHFNGQSGRRPMIILGVGQATLLFASWAIDHALGRARPLDDVIIFIHAVTWPIGYAGFFLCMRYRQYLANPVLGWLGKISYSVYLLHMPVLSLLVPLHLPNGVYFPLLFAGTLALSHVTFHWVEAPGITLGRALEKRWLPRRNTAAPPDRLPVAQAA
jgi:peptidoglycan/LPS O-acetylase OafA/YrhL